MKKIATLLVISIFIQWQLSAQCNPDIEAPVLISNNGLNENIQQSGNLVLWLADIVQAVQDNCSAQNDIQLSLRRCGACTGFPLTSDGAPVDHITFTCNDLGTQLVEVWARDAAGNMAVDTAYLFIQDNDSRCSNSNNVSGLSCAHTEYNAPISNIAWNITGGNPALPPTSSFGDVSSGPCMEMIQGIPFGGIYSIHPVRDNDPLNGVSTFDLVLINKHILGLQTLDSPYKMLAADANNSRSITTFDIVEIRKLILGIYPDFPNNTSWRFVPKSYVFPNPQNPVQTLVPDTISLAQVMAGNGDFIGYKVGDVNGNAAACNGLIAPEARGTTPLVSDDALLQPGETTRIAWRLPEPQRLLGAQFALQFDPELVEITGLEFGPGLNNEPAEGYYALPEPGVLNFSWNAETASETKPGQAMIYLTVKALQTIQWSQAIQWRKNGLRPELYIGPGKPQSMSLEFTPLPLRSRTEIFPAAPNPSSRQVYIPVNLSQPETVRIDVYDLSGREIYFSEQTLAAGFERILIPESALAGQTGVLAYRVHAGEALLTGKLFR